MSASSNSSFTTDTLLSAWSTEWLKKFLKEDIPVSGLKHKLIMKANNFIESEALESELDVKTFNELQVEDLACKY